eukprot:TRINITY_DN2969_c1_g3_i1.p1 TRINITY_DN2969_c1_g3~~TRINITY_DN2969_c1_g3_i1.p1  ORF type:complete len:133 (+),score=28.45 TRINITY_DN2969_c1_g3_i1:37-399(+)
MAKSRLVSGLISFLFQGIIIVCSLLIKPFLQKDPLPLCGGLFGGAFFFFCFTMLFNLMQKVNIYNIAISVFCSAIVGGLIHPIAISSTIMVDVAIIVFLYFKTGNKKEISTPKNKKSKSN